MTAQDAVEDKIASEIQESRRQRGWSVETAAALANVAVKTWVRAERGEEVRPSSLERILSALEVDTRRWRQRRETLGLSLRELAGRAEVAVATVQRLEHGLPVRGTSLRKVAAALGTDPDALVQTHLKPVADSVSGDGRPPRSDLGLASTIVAQLADRDRGATEDVIFLAARTWLRELLPVAPSLSLASEELSS